MDRWRRGSVVAAEGRRKGQQQSGGGGGYGQMVEPQIENKYGGSMVAPKQRYDDESLVIDPNLLVGPLYVPTTTRTDAIKEQLGDITNKLHNTLYQFDEFADFEHDEDPLVGLMRKQIGNIDDDTMKHNLSHFMDQYEDMSMQVSDANKDRDEMLMQLADWFTTDHMDLDDIKSSIDDTEEENIKQGYFDTVTNFEKLKKLQMQITNASSQGKSTRRLQMAKQELEKDVVDKFKVMKDMSMQTMKLKTSDDAPWKHAANEIVSMLRNVRTENADELTAIHKKMQEMIDQLEKQAMTIKSYKLELKEKKEVCRNLTDENGDLNQEVALFRARYTRYEKELEQAKQLLRKLNQEKNGDTKDSAPVSVQDKTPSESISTVLARLDEPAGDLKRYGSDPALLRTQLREYQDALEVIRSEFSRSAEEVDELNKELAEKKEYITNIENENTKLSRDVKKLRQERRQSIAAGAIIPPPGEGHQCEHCKCHVPEKDVDEEALQAEAQKWQDKCNYFKKCLADAEMKLSDAYKEISDLRMDRDPPPPAEKPKAAKEEETKPEEKKPKEAASKAEKREKKQTDEDSKPKPKREVKARYLQNKQSERRNLPPIERQVDQRLDEQPGLTKQQSRELKLYKAGDLQGMLNLLVTEIMEFVTEVGKLLYKEKEDDSGKIQSMKAFAFDNGSQSKKDKELRDPKEEEAKQKKSQVIFNGQHACAKLREAFDCLSSSMELQHNEYEAIYRSFKISQQRNSIRKDVIMGRLPVSALQDFDRAQHQKMKAGGPDNMLNVYFNISYGGGQGGMGISTKVRQANSLHKRTSSMFSLQSDSEEPDAKLKNTMNVLSINRSKSDLDIMDGMSIMGGSGGQGFYKEGGRMFPTADMSRKRDSLSQGNKHEMKIGVAHVPRKGLIALQTNDAEIFNQPQDIGIQGERRQSIATPSGPASAKNRSLIKRTDILDHIKMGNKLLEESEMAKKKEEEVAQSLGDYTILDLQSKILDMTDAKSARRQRGQDLLSDTPNQQKRSAPTNIDKHVTLPAINNLNPFKM